MRINSHTKFQLGFLKFQFFNGENGQESGTASLCQISSKSLELRPRYGDFSFFKDGDRRHLKFLKFEICNVRNGQRNHAKFCRNRSNRGRDIAIFRIFKMADAAMLDF